MKNTILTKRRILALAISLAVTFLLLVGATTYAAYTNSRYAQRTVATNDSTGDRFSSNLLAKRNSKDNVKTLYVTDEAIHPNTVVTICNYEQGKRTQPYDRDVTYSLTARLVYFDDSTTEKYVPADAAYLSANSLTSYSITITNNLTTITLNASHLSDSTFGRTLTANTPDSDAFAISFDTNFAPDRPNLYLELVATPSGNLLPILRGVFRAEMRAEGASNAWTGSFGDDISVTPSSYDGYNYVVSGVGSGVVTLSWDGTKVSPSAFSLSALLALDGATQEGNSVSFPVDSDETARFDLQFYKVNITTETWTQMNNTVVTFSFR